MTRPHRSRLVRLRPKQPREPHVRVPRVAPSLTLIPSTRAGPRGASQARGVTRPETRSSEPV